MTHEIDIQRIQRIQREHHNARAKELAKEVVGFVGGWLMVIGYCAFVMGGAK